MNATDKINDTLERSLGINSQLYACAVQYEEPGSIDHFKKQSNKVSLNVGISVNRMIPTAFIMYTGRGQNLLSSALLPHKWLGKVKKMADPGLTAATRNSVDIQEVIRLHLQLGTCECPYYFEL